MSRRLPEPPPAKAVMFVNWSTEHFTYTWAKAPYEFPPGQTFYMEEWKANHFAKHLTNREMFKRGVENFLDPLYKQLYAKCFVEAPVPQAAAMTEGERSKMATDMLQMNSQIAPEPVVAPAAVAPAVEEALTESQKAFHAKWKCDTCDTKGIRHKMGCPKYK